MKTNLHNILGADPILLEEGIWVTICRGICFKISSSESRRYKAATRAALVAHANFDGAGSTLPEDVAKTVLIESIASGMLHDWEGITDDEGKELPFSVEEAKALLADPELGLVIDRTLEASHRLVSYRRQQIETAEKNSQSRSTGTLSGATKKSGSKSSKKKGPTRPL